MREDYWLAQKKPARERAEPIQTPVAIEKTAYRENV
jgi:hypothetical protein